MKTISKKEMNTGKEIVEKLGMAKTALAINKYNVETNAVGERMFLYNDEKIKLYTTGKTFFGFIKDGNKKFTYDPSSKLPYVVGYADAKTRTEVKDMIKNVFENHKDALMLSNAYKELTEQFENVLAYVVKAKAVKGTSLPESIQMKYDWVLDPGFISVVDDAQGEAAATNAKKDDTNNKEIGVTKMVKRIERNQIMSVAHAIRKTKEATDSEYVKDRYVVRMAIALCEAWDLYKSQDNKTVIKEIAPDVEPKIMREAASTEHPKKVVNMADHVAKDKLTAKKDGNFIREEGKFYVTSTPGHVNVEDYTGKVLQHFDVTHLQYAKRSFSELKVKFTEDAFAKSKFYNENAFRLCIVTSNIEIYSQHKIPQKFIPIKL